MNDVIRFAHNDVMLRIMMLLVKTRNEAMLAIVAKPHIIAAGNIIGLKPTSFARRGKHHFKKAPNGCLFDQPRL